MNKFTIAMDIDDICAKLMDEWLRRYNADYKDRLAEKDILGWGVSKFVKPECGNRMYEYLHDPTIYDNVKVTRGALEGIKELRKMGHRVVFVTATAIGSAGRKFKWLNDNGFSVELKDYAEITDKSLIRADFMFDDRYDNVKTFGGTAVLMTRPWNKNEVYPIRVTSWKEFLNIVRKATK